MKFIMCAYYKYLINKTILWLPKSPFNAIIQYRRTTMTLIKFEVSYQLAGSGTVYKTVTEAAAYCFAKTMVENMNGGASNCRIVGVVEQRS